MLSSKTNRSVAGPAIVERDVVAAAVQPVGLVPGVVHRDLVLVRAGRAPELGGVHTGGVGRGEFGLRAVGLPVVGAARARSAGCRRA